MLHELLLNSTSGQDERPTARVLIDASIAGVADAILINPAVPTPPWRCVMPARGQPPTWSVHLTEPRTREPYRQVDLIEDLCVGRTAVEGGVLHRGATTVNWLNTPHGTCPPEPPGLSAKCTGRGHGVRCFRLSSRS